MQLNPLVRPVVIPFPSWTLTTCQSVVATPPWMRANRQFWEGNHFQNGEGWVGPVPSYNEPGAAQMVAEIMRGFTSENVLREMADRRRDAVIGREVTWQLVPRRLTSTGVASAEDQSLIDEAMDFLTPWYDERHLHQELQDWTSTLLWAGRSELRALVPPGFLVDGTVNGRPVKVLRARDAADALRQLYIEKVEPEASTVYENPRTRERAGVYLYNDNDQQRAELVYLDRPTQRTVMQQLGGGNQQMPVQLELGGRLTMYESRDAVFLTEQLRQMQKALNLSLSMLPRNIVTGGFLDMIITNGEMPGRWVKDVAGDRLDKDGDKAFFYPNPLYRGAGVVNWVQGIDLGVKEDRSGQQQQISTPGVVFRPPTPVTAAIEANGELYTRMLNAAQQVHVLLNTSALPSGISREQARAGFISSVRPTRTRVQGAGRWTIETALAWVEMMTGQPGRYTSRLRVDFQTHLDVGPVSVEERAQDLLEVEAGTLSEETAMERAGVEDTDTERQRIDNSPRGRVALATEQAAAVQAWHDIGVPFLEACEMVGVDKKLAKMMNDARLLAEGTGGIDDPNAPQPGSNPTGAGAGGQ